MALPTNSKKYGCDSNWRRLQQQVAHCLLRGCVFLALAGGIVLSACEQAENINAPRIVDDPFIVNNITFTGVLFKLDQPDDPSSDRVFDLNLKLIQDATIDTSQTPPLVKLHIHQRRSPGTLINVDDESVRYWLDEFEISTDFLAADGTELRGGSTNGSETAASLPFSFELNDWKQERTYSISSADSDNAGTLRLWLEDFRGEPGQPGITRIIIVNTEFETRLNNQDVKISGKFEIDYADKF